MPLSARRQRFVNAYLGDAAGNATQAVLDAKLTQNHNSARVIGCRLLAEASVQQAITDATASSQFTIERAIEELSTIAEFKVEKVTSGDKLKAIELFLKAKGALRDNTGESRVTVNIGFLGASQPTLAIKHVMGRGATVALLGAEADPVEP